MCKIVVKVDELGHQIILTQRKLKVVIEWLTFLKFQHSDFFSERRLTHNASEFSSWMFCLKTRW
jgi:predicted glycosyltransferase